MVGILFSMRHLLSIASIISYQNIISSSVFLVFSNATTFLYSSLRKGYTMGMEVSPSVAGGGGDSTARFVEDGM